MATWRENLRPASFRGVGFFVTEDDLSVGRRLQVHEYPQRDKPFTEDLGRKAREISITAYVIGDDYMDKRDALLKALETAGSGTLVHPYYGQMTVHAEVARVSTSLDEGGMCRFSLTFKETGELEFPGARVNTGAKTRVAADKLKTAAVKEFAGKFSLSGMPSFGLTSALSGLTAGISGITAAIGNVKAGLSLVSSIAELVQNPSLLAEALFDLIDPNGFLSMSADSILSQIDDLLDLFDDHDESVSVSSTATATRQQEAANTEAINALVRSVALVNASGMATLISHPVFDDAESLREKMVGAIESSRAKATDETFYPLAELKTSIQTFFMQETRQSARLNNLTPSYVMPAAVLAYQLYGDATRGDEITARNKIRHPGFVPVEPIKVLSE